MFDGLLNRSCFLQVEPPRPDLQADIQFKDEVLSLTPCHCECISKLLNAGAALTQHRLHVLTVMLQATQQLAPLGELAQVSHAAQDQSAFRCCPSRQVYLAMCHSCKHTWLHALGPGALMQFPNTTCLLCSLLS